MSKMDPGSNYTFSEIMSDADFDAGTAYSSAIDHSTGESATVLITTLIACTTCVATVQHSSDNGVSDAFTDQTDDGSGNDISVDIGTAVETNQLNIPNPVERYTRIKIVSTGDDSAVTMTACVGPNLENIPSVTTTRAHP